MMAGVGQARGSCAGGQALDITEDAVGLKTQLNTLFHEIEDEI